MIPAQPIVDREILPDSPSVSSKHSLDILPFPAFTSRVVSRTRRANLADDKTGLRVAVCACWEASLRIREAEGPGFAGG